MDYNPDKHTVGDPELDVLLTTRSTFNVYNDHAQSLLGKYNASKHTVGDPKLDVLTDIRTELTNVNRVYEYAEERNLIPITAQDGNYQVINSFTTSDIRAGTYELKVTAEYSMKDKNDSIFIRLVSPVTSGTSYVMQPSAVTNEDIMTVVVPLHWTGGVIDFTLEASTTIGAVDPLVTYSAIIIDGKLYD